MSDGHEDGGGGDGGGKARNWAVVSVGSNIEPAANTQRAEEILAAEQHLAGRAEYRRTAPVGLTDQPDFLNGAYLLGTDLARDELVRYLKGVEDRLGRTRTGPKAGPRTLDLDLILWNGKVVHRDYHQAPYARGPVDELVAAHGLTLEETSLEEIEAARRHSDASGNE